MQRMLAEVVVPETTTRFIETQITNKSLTNILWNILLSILLGLTGQSDLTHLRLVTQPVGRMLSSASLVPSSCPTQKSMIDRLTTSVFLRA